MSTTQSESSPLDNPSTDETSEEINSLASISLAKGAGLGVLTAAFGLAVSELLAGFSRSWRSPVLDVGDRVIDRVPSWLKDIAIDLFGTYDKIALLAGIGSIVAVYAALVGIASLRKSLQVGLYGIAIFGLAGILSAAFPRTGFDPAQAIPALLGSGAAAYALTWLVRSIKHETNALDQATHDQATQTGVPEASVSETATANIGALVAGRRGFMASAGALAVVGTTAAATGRWLNGRLAQAQSRLGLALPFAAEPLDEVSPAIQAVNAAPFFTSNEDFYRIDTALSVPQIALDDWSIAITGMVDSEITFTYDQLLSEFEVVEEDITLTCVSNTIGGELMGTARWLGVRLDEVLERAGISSGANQIVGRSVDGYTCGFPVSTLDGRPALIAVGMNGVPLPPEHGFPARLITPGLYGYVSATKWLSEIELTTFDAFDHYWVPRGYSVEAPIKLQSRIDTPRGLDRIPVGPTVIGGVAWAQTIGIDSVQLSIDEGDWVDVDMAEELNDLTWRQWSFPWDATEGRHSITVRAKDRNGTVQTPDRAEPLPNGASGHHTVVVLVG